MADKIFIFGELDSQTDSQILADTDIIYDRHWGYSGLNQTEINGYIKDKLDEVDSLEEEFSVVMENIEAIRTIADSYSILEPIYESLADTTLESIYESLSEISVVANSMTDITELVSVIDTYTGSIVIGGVIVTPNTSNNTIELTSSGSDISLNNIVSYDNSNNEWNVNASVFRVNSTDTLNIGSNLVTLSTSNNVNVTLDDGATFGGLSNPQVVSMEFVDNNSNTYTISVLGIITV